VSYSASVASRHLVRNVITIFLTIYAMLGTPLSLWAHPLGNFTVNRYSRLEVGDTQVYLEYIIDMAEIPTQQEVAVIDQDRDGKLSDEEIALYLEDMVGLVAANAHLFINDIHVTWRMVEQQVELFPGQADLPTLRLSARFVADLPPGPVWSAEYLDDNYADRLGWREVIVRAQQGVTLVESSAPPQDISDGLRNYPEDLLQSPPAVDGATFHFEATPGRGRVMQPRETTRGQPEAAASRDRPTDGFAELITQRAAGPGAILLALVAAYGWGALHALSPGHGKTIVAAYLVGARGTVKHAFFLGMATTITHTAGVFALGFVTLFLSRYLLPETLYPWLSLLSGLLVVVIGLSLLRGRAGALFSLAPAGDSHDHHHPHFHPHHHAHNDTHDHEHDHAHGHRHNHIPPSADGEPVTWRALLALGVSGGLIPCPSALVLMLGAIALDRIAFGLVLILVFSIGLASVLTVIGVALVVAGRLFDQIPAVGRLLRVMPVASAIFITLVGVGISWQALVQAGVLRLN
jgi:nickel/cobalt transporter (NicO) family protein